MVAYLAPIERLLRCWDAWGLPKTEDDGPVPAVRKAPVPWVDARTEERTGLVAAQVPAWADAMGYRMIHFPVSWAQESEYREDQASSVQAVDFQTVRRAADKFRGGVEGLQCRSGTNGEEVVAQEVVAAHTEVGLRSRGTVDDRRNGANKM